MKHRTRLIAAGAVALALALPAGAGAHERPTLAGVRQHAQAAQRALDTAASFVKAGKDRRAAKALTRERRQLRAARRGAKRLRRRAHSVRALRRSAAAERAVGVVSNECVDTLTAIVGEAGDPAQLDIAQAITACIRIRESIIDTLSGLLAVLPEEARPVVAEVIAALSSGGLDEVDAIGGLLETPGLPPEVGSALSTALDLAIGAIHDALDQLSSIVPLLPAEAQPVVQQALTLVGQQLEQVRALLTGLFDELIGGGPADPGATPPASGGVLPGLPGLPGLGELLGWLGLGLPGG